MFESSVNSEGIETKSKNMTTCSKFESSVNSEGIETHRKDYVHRISFESSVNSEGIETIPNGSTIVIRLRAV